MFKQESVRIREQINLISCKVIIDIYMGKIVKYYGAKRFYGGIYE